MNSKKVEKYVIMDEIKSQGEKWALIIKKYYEMKNVIFSEITDDSLFYFLGSGSSYNNCLMAEFAYNKLMNKISYAINSSEYLFNPDVFIKNYSKNKKIFIISRTGETTDTLLTQKMLKKKKMFLISLTTFPNSSIARNSNLVIDLKELREESITSNRVVSGMTLFLLCLFYKLSGKESYIDKINKYAKKFFENFDRYYDYILSVINELDFNKFIFLGHGPFFSISREAALKVREMSITDTEFWPTLEYRQGYSTNTDEDNLVVIYLSKKHIDFQVKTCMELKKSGTKIFVVNDNIKLTKYEKFYNYILEINLGLEDELFCQVYYQVFGQLIGYHQAVKKKIDPSNPRNLEYIVKI